MSLDISDAMAMGATAPAPSPPGGTTETPRPATSTPAPDFQGKGYLLSEPDQKRVCKRVEKLWKGQNATMQPRDEQWRANELTMAGVPGVRLIKDVDTDTWIARVPFGASAVRIGIPKTKELSDKVTATIHSDPPAPDAQPSPDDQGDLAKADLCTRILRNECTEAGLDLHAKLRTASALGATYGSGFLVLDVDPTGGGWTPLAIDAHPAATHFDPANPDAVLQHPDGPEAEMEPTPPTRRYLARRATPPAPSLGNDAPSLGDPGASLGDEAASLGGEGPSAAEPDPRVPQTDDPAQAQRQWQLKLRCAVVTGRRLRFLPMLATGIEDADGVLLADVTTFGALRGMFPDINTWPKERQAKLTTWRPGDVEMRALLPPGVVVPETSPTVDSEGDPREGLPADEALCLTLRVIYKAHPAYPDGADVLCAGGDAVLHRDTRCVWVGEGADARPECLDVNVVQVRRHEDETGGNPYGIGDAQLLGPGDDLRGQLLVDAVERIWQVNHPNLLVPLGSPIDAGALERRDGTPLYFQPAAGAPIYEQPPGMDPNTLNLYSAIGREMDGRAGLEDAQQLNNPNITSGKQANAVVEQSLTILSPQNASVKKAAARCFRVTLQLYRAFATRPQMLRYTGEDGRYLVKEFTNTDLGSARDVRIAAGTSTMLSQSAKMQLAQSDLEIALKANDVEGGYRRYRQAIAANLDPTLGRDQDPHHRRAMRQIHAWREFVRTPDAQQPPPPPMLGMGPTMGPGTPGLQTGQAVPGIPTGSAVPVPPPDPTQTPDPRALALFEPRPVDAQPDVAKTRALALGDELARETTEQAPPWARLALEAAYDKARRDAGQAFMTEAEKQAAMQQQQQAQQMAQQQQTEQRAQQSRETTHATLQAKASEGEANRASAIERTRMQAASRNGAPSMAGAGA